MTSKDAKTRSAITERAADWFASHDADPSKDSAELLIWLKDSPQHVEEFLGVATLARDLRLARDDPFFSVESLLERARRDVGELGSPVSAPETGVQPRARRWHTLALAATVILVGVLVVLYWQVRPTTRAPVGYVTELHFATRHGEQRTVDLPDQSVLRLDTATAVTVRYSGTERGVTIHSGQGEFEVRHDPQRPFRVLTDSAEIRDIGTTLNVRTLGGSTQITVLEGRVAVAPRSTRAPPVASVELGPDQQIEVTEGHWPAVPMQVDAQRTTAWLRRELVFEQTPLEKVAAEINRYAPKPVEIDSPALRQLPISGVFSTDDPEALVAFLRSLDGVKVEETPARVRVSKK
jgi:transmembrane sensor